MIENYLTTDFDAQEAILLLFPYRKDIWRKGGIPIQNYIVSLANTMARYQKVILGVHPQLFRYAVDNFQIDSSVEIWKVEYNDIWPRDFVGSVLMKNGQWMLADFAFNAYGGELYSCWDEDDQFTSKLAKKINLPLVRSNIIAEWGNIMPDGNGNVFVIEDSIVNKNRNPSLSKEDIEKEMKDLLGIKKVFWIPKGLVGDETGGHIDNLINFTDNKTVFLAWTDDRKSANYNIVRDAEKQLKAVRLDSGGYEIVKLPIPNAKPRSKEECDGIVKKEGSFRRAEKDRILESYINFVVLNKAIVVPVFNHQQDNEALELFKAHANGLDIVPLYSREAALGGGGVHCLTKQISNWRVL